MALLPAETAALADLRRWLEGRFGQRLDGLLLFGSRARGQGHPESDLDVLVVERELSSAERREVGHFSGDLLTRHGVLVAPLALSVAERDHLRARERRIIAEIDRDGVPL